jgi:hypothetical protein
VTSTAGAGQALPPTLTSRIRGLENGGLASSVSSKFVIRYDQRGVV